MEILSLNNLSVSYGGGPPAVDGISLTVKEGEIVSIVGESGSGKSTLLHSLLGLLPRPAHCAWDRFSLLGQEATGPGWEKALARMRGRDVSMIFQDAGRYMNPIARVGKQYDAFLRCHVRMTAEETRRRQEEMLSRVHLQDPERILRAYPFELSGGMRQRVSIAMAMTLEPRLLLADEPTSALDVTLQAQVARQMLELRAQYGTTIILVTHNMGLAACLSDRIGVMQKGRLLELGDADAVISHPQAAYTRALLSAVIELEDERIASK